MLFKDCLCFQVGKVSRKMAKLTRDAVGPYGLTPTQFFLLTDLYHKINRKFLSFLTEEEQKTFEQVVSKIENADLTKG